MLSITLLAFSCSKDGEPFEPVPPNIEIPDTTKDDTTTNDTIQKQPEKTKIEILAKKWIVSEAYVNGSTLDNSSKGLGLDIRTDGTYTLSTGYIGTWEFLEDETKILWDEKETFTQTFDLNTFEEDLIDATFISGFTGQNARWVMVPD